MATPTILVTGANGQLGKEIQQLATQYAACSFLFVTKEELPIHDSALVNAYFKKHTPAYCINCAAYTAVDKAEAEKEMAMLVNGEAVGILAEVCKSFNTKFIHISTDYVFDGNNTNPYTENEKTNPVNFYGSTKLKGEELCLAKNNDSIVIRTSWVYSEFGNNFVKTMMRLMKDRDNLNVVSDQMGSPTYALDLANAILQIITHTQQLTTNWQAGIYHYSNEGVISWYDFAVTINEYSRNLHCKVNPIPTSAYPTPAKRPAYSVFNKEKIKKVYNIQIPNWKESLKICIDKIIAG